MPVVARARCFVNDRPVISTARVTGQDRGVLGTIGISDLGPDQRRGRLLAGGRFCVSWSVPHNWVLTLHNRSEHVADGVLLISGQRRPRTNQLGGLIDGVVLYSSGISAPLGELLVGQLGSIGPFTGHWRETSNHCKLRQPCPGWTGPALRRRCLVAGHLVWFGLWPAYQIAGNSSTSQEHYFPSA
jgi:hypothetical protein